MTIWKYILKPTCTIEMPEGSLILSVQAQLQADGVLEEVCMWVLVDPDLPKVPREFVVYGTGHPVRDDRVEKFLGTVQLSGGKLVFHVFEVPK